MATLEILEILGIRSFGPNEAQKLQFINPVTLIHGPNGSGKTVMLWNMAFESSILYYIPHYFLIFFRDMVSALFSRQ